MCFIADLLPLVSFNILDGYFTATILEAKILDPVLGPHWNMYTNNQFEVLVLFPPFTLSYSSWDSTNVKGGHVLSISAALVAAFQKTALRAGAAAWSSKSTVAGVHWEKIHDFILMDGPEAKNVQARMPSCLASPKPSSSSRPVDTPCPPASSTEDPPRVRFMASLAFLNQWRDEEHDSDD